MVKTYLIDKDYLEKFLNMVTLDTVHSIHITPTEQYNVICTHTTSQSGVYSYAYRVLTARVAPVRENVQQSTVISSFGDSYKMYNRTYDTRDPLSKEEQDLLVECFKTLLPDAECEFSSSRNFTLTTVVQVD